MNLQQYQQLNRSFRRRLVFHMGCDAGFFAEFTYMVNGMIYCLDHHLQFVMYSDDANFGTGQGWTEFFKPFCDEVHEPLHHRYNRHTQPTWQEVFRAARERKSPDIVVWRLKGIVNYLVGKAVAFSHYHHCVGFGQDIRIDTEKHYQIPELGIDGDYLDTFNQLAQMVWRFNDEMHALKNAYLQQLNLPTEYAGTQIRGGDKVIETDLIDNDVFLKKIITTGQKNVFLLTDDYRIYEQLQQHSSTDLQVFTLCQPDEYGYEHQAFCAQDQNKKKQKIAKLLVSVDILLHSKYFVGTITCGPSLYVLKQKISDGAIAVDCAASQLRHALTLKIPQRAAISQNYIK